VSNVIEFHPPKIHRVCSFCDKPRERVDILIAVGTAGKLHICGRCVAKCTHLMKSVDNPSDT